MAVFSPLRATSPSSSPYPFHPDRLDPAGSPAPAGAGDDASVNWYYSNYDTAEGAGGAIGGGGGGGGGGRGRPLLEPILDRGGRADPEAEAEAESSAAAFSSSVSACILLALLVQRLLI